MSRFARVAIGLAAGAVAACGGVDESHPGAAMTDTAIVVERDEPVTCTPSELRACHHYYVDERGQLQCPLSAQQCSAAGNAWSACGSLAPPSSDDAGADAQPH